MHRTPAMRKFCLPAVLLPAAACLPRHAETLVDLDVIDRDSGASCPKTVTVTTPGCPASPANAMWCA